MDASVRLLGLGKAVRCNGFNASYGVNQIPQASVSIDPAETEVISKIICNINEYKNRQKQVTIEVTTVNGCTRFDGYIDGLNVIQAVGQFGYELVIKSRFQRMVEIYPKMVGVHPMGQQFFTRKTNFRVEVGTGNNMQISLYAAAASITNTKSIAELIINFLKMLLSTQKNPTQYIPNNGRNELSALLNVFEDEKYNENIDEGIALLDLVDISAVQDSAVDASQICATLLGKFIDSSESSLWSMLISSLEYFGCCVVAGNDKIFVLPKCNYMDLPGLKEPGYKTTKSMINVAYPANYDNFVLSDGEYENVRYSVVLWSAVGYNSMLGTGGKIGYDLGCYPQLDGSTVDEDIPEDGATGVLITELPPFISLGMEGSFRNLKRREEIQDKDTPRLTGPIDIEEQKKKFIENHKETYDKIAEDRKVYIDEWAKMMLLQAKYTGRNGSVNMLFNPGWCPGTTGALFTRYPGLFIAFYVTQVSHSVSISAEGSGSMTTSVAFDSGRYVKGDMRGLGFKELKMYSFTSDKMVKLQKDFVGSIS